MPRGRSCACRCGGHRSPRDRRSSARAHTGRHRRPRRGPRRRAHRAGQAAPPCGLSRAQAHRAARPARDEGSRGPGVMKANVRAPLTPQAAADHAPRPTLSEVAANGSPGPSAQRDVCPATVLLSNAVRRTAAARGCSLAALQTLRISVTARGASSVGHIAASAGAGCDAARQRARF